MDIRLLKKDDVTHSIRLQDGKVSGQAIPCDGEHTAVFRAGQCEAFTLAGSDTGFYSIACATRSRSKDNATESIVTSRIR